MIIHKPKIESKEDKIRISSYIEIETKKEFSNTLWYEFDKEYEKYISKSLNGFLSAMIMFAMYLNEDIKVKGKISPKLAYGLKELQGYFNFWYPKKFNKIEIISEGYEVKKENPKGVMCTFSGGADAFYTLWKHLPRNEPNPHNQITHCLIIDGFAVPRSEKMNKSYEIIKESYQKLISKLGLKFVFVKTNLADFYHRRIPPASIDGPVLSVVPQLLDKLISRFHIPSCLSYSQILPRGSNAITNQLLSTEELSITIHGSDKSRAEKILEIIKWPETYNHLRVCWDDFGVSNCCECEKCIRTMIVLKTAGVLNKCKTFPKPLTRKKIRDWKLYETYNFWFAEENLKYARKKRRKDIIFDIKYAVLKNKMLNYYNKKSYLIWLPSAYLKRRSKLYRKFVKVIKNKINYK
ncbi:hypothetical protein KY334_07265 [Candidatus Woesearchaeota archaeon]|nr:hypothetical protein [Candidatus Woesearchaeota archaeon]